MVCWVSGAEPAAAAGWHARAPLLLLAALITPPACPGALPPPPGMMFVLLYGRKGLFAPLIAKTGFQVIFAFPGGQ